MSPVTPKRIRLSLAEKAKIIEDLMDSIRKKLKKNMESQDQQY